MADRYLDNPDFWCELALADSVKRALIRHFDTFLHRQICDRGFNSRDSNLLNQDTIAGTAWDLADKVIGSVKADFTDVWEVATDPAFGNIREWVTASLGQELEEVKQEYLADELGGLDCLIGTASGTPIGIAGTGKSIDFGMGPDEDD